MLYIITNTCKPMSKSSFAENVKCCTVFSLILLFNCCLINVLFWLHKSVSYSRFVYLQSFLLLILLPFLVSLRIICSYFSYVYEKRRRFAKCFWHYACDFNLTMFIALFLDLICFCYLTFIHVLILLFEIFAFLATWKVLSQICINISTLKYLHL